MRLLLSVLAVTLFVSSSAMADEDSCSQSCPSGQVLVSFADGNNATCLCQDIGATMSDTPEVTINCNDPEDDGSCE